MDHEPIPFVKVQALTDNIRDLLLLERQRAGTQAQLIRWCVWALNQTTEQAARRLERERTQEQQAGKRYRPVGFSEPHKKVAKDRALALLHLEWLATQLEDQSVGSSDNQPKEP